MKGLIELFPQCIHVSDEGQRRSCIMKEISAEGESTKKELWFVYPVGLPMPKDDDCDSYLLGVLLLGMRLDANIVVHGSVSKELLANLTELQLIWNNWCPDIYSLVEMKVNEIRENDIQVDGTVSAFSGGADAQFTVYRHATGKAGQCTQKISAGVLVHGFDIPITDTKGFSGAAKKASETLSDLELSLLVVKTNIRTLNLNWEHHCGLAIASVLSGLNMYAGTGLISSGSPYSELDIWGSHPMTDPLFSSDSFRIMHDGAGFSRSEKIELLAEWSVGMKNLRVCWEGEIRDRNCGSCEKCVRTRMNFLIAGVLDPACFDSPLDPSLLRNIALHGEGSVRNWRKIRSDIKRTRNGIEWLPEVEKVLKRKPKIKLGLLLPTGSKRRTLIKNLLKKT